MRKDSSQNKEHKKDISKPLVASKQEVDRLLKQGLKEYSEVLKALAKR